MSVKIKTLEVENVKRVKAVTIEPTSNGLTIIGGKNNQGKTSIIDSIAWALGGEKYRPSTPQRDGSVIPPHLKLTLSNGLVVERSGKNSSLKVIDPNGKKSGQQLLNSFVEVLALDLPKFMESSSKDKASTLLKIIGVGDTLYKLDSEEQKLYNQRHAIGTIADQKKKFAKEMPVYEGVPSVPVSASELIRQQQEILARNDENQRKRENLSQLQFKQKQLSDRISQYEAELLKLKNEYSTVSNDVVQAKKFADNLVDESTSELEKNISEIDEINRKVRANIDREKADIEAKGYSKQYDTLSQQIEDIRTQRRKLLDNADTLAYIVSSDLDVIEVNSDKWEEIEKVTDFRNVVNKAIVDTLVCGDGVFKISVDKDISEYPIVEFISGENVDFENKHGIISEVVFRSAYTVKSKRFELRERCGKGFVESRLFDSNGNEYPLDAIPEIADIDPAFPFEGDYMFAVPLKFYESKKHKCRGKSIFDGGKSDCFDALDEVVSQWLNALRDGRVQKYIPESLLPRNPDNGCISRLNRFGTEFIAIGAALGDGDSGNKIEVVQPDIKYEAFVSSYTNALLMCLQGLVSPATLGIDVGKMSSAEAQREKKDVTGNTRNTITTALEKALPQLIEAILKTYDLMQDNVPGEYEAAVSFGEYGAPDFDSRVETIGKASSYGIMSVETPVDELWGSSKDDE